MEDCIFCKIAKGDIPHEEFIYENDNFFSVADINPVLEGHTLIIPKKHFETILDMPDDLSLDLLDCIKKTANRLMKKYNVEGFNVLNNNFEVAQQIVKHVHFHVLPRKKGDGEFRFEKSS